MDIERFSKVLTLSTYETRANIVGVPCNFGQSKTGVEKGPHHLRAYGITQLLREDGFEVADKGDVKFEKITDDPDYKNVKKPRTVGYGNKMIADAVSNNIRDRQICLVLGGDHSLAVGSIFGHARVQPNLMVVWVDAHGDINPPMDSPSGNIHGMPLAFLAKEMTHYIPKDIPGFEWIYPCLSVQDMAYIGLRDLDVVEKRVIEEYNMIAYDMQDITEKGISTVMREIMNRLNPNKDRPIHMSFDIDSLDPKIAPSTGTPVPGGLSLREALYIAQTLEETGMLTCVDLVEVNPDLGNEKGKRSTMEAAREILSACIRKKRRSNLKSQ